MVDASFGETGISVGKNLDGAFHSPRRVVNKSRSPRNFEPRRLSRRAGEVVKCGFISDPAILSIVGEANPEAMIPVLGDPLARHRTMLPLRHE